MAYGISKIDFYHYCKYVAIKQCSQYHGSKGRKKTSCSVEQVIQTMSMILTTKIKFMLNRPQTDKCILKGQKVMEKIQPNGTNLQSGRK